jgi:hypothetical protein
MYVFLFIILGTDLFADNLMYFFTKNVLEA